MPQPEGEKLWRYSLEKKEPTIAPALDPKIAKLMSKASGSSPCASIVILPLLSVDCSEKSFFSTSISSDTFLKVGETFFV
jgi:hypothetical protein